MSEVVSIRLAKNDRAALEEQAKAKGETLGRYCRRVLERGAEADATIYAIRAEARASAERSEALVIQQAAAVQALINTLQAALAAPA
jgi:DNA-directed RNA polymerase subunit L